MAPGIDDLRSLALRTEIAVARRGCELARREGYWVVRTPADPDYWFGNALIFDVPPGPGDFERWMARFEREHPGSEHRVFEVDDTTGDVGHTAAFVAAGFEVEQLHVLTANAVVPPPKLDPDVELRPIRADDEWEAVAALEVRSGVEDEGHTAGEAHTAFCRRRVQTRRAMQAEGLGHVWGAFLGGELVAKLGLFHVGGLSRFQAVVTAASHRRRGICGTLVHHVCADALQERPDRRLVMCAFEDYHATRIYQSVGFRVTERIVNYVRRPPGA
jgi:ribosomal protein S18 acetylase RimI-like enzyme